LAFFSRSMAGVMFECENNLARLAYLSRKICREQFLTPRSSGP
jgi:uncharacterized membrane-anchored protein